MVNRYDSPAQAQFMNTYVPIPFEQLYNLGREANARVDKALSDYSGTLDKWSDFKSQSNKDMQTWYNETIGKAKPVIDEMANNLDMIKTPEGRMKLYSVINNVDRAKLSALKQSATNFEAYNKVKQDLIARGQYNPAWHDRDFSSYDTTAQGLYSDISPLAYKSEVQMVEPFVNNIKPSDLGIEKGYLMHGVTQEAVRAQVDKNLSSMLNTPEARQHIATLQRQGLTPQQATERFIQNIYTASDEFVWKDKAGIDQFALEAMRERERRNNKKKEDKEAIPAPSVYDMLLADAKRNEDEVISAVDAFGKSKNARNFASVLDQKRNEAMKELDVYKQALAKGQITQKQYDRATEQYKDEFVKSSESLAKDLSNAYRDDVRELFTYRSGLAPSTVNEKTNPVGYYSGSSKLLDNIMKPLSGDELARYNTMKYGNPISINQNNIPTDAYIASTTSGFNISSVTANKLMDKKNAPMYIKDNRGKSVDFLNSLNSGAIKNVLIVPTNTAMAQRDYTTNETPKLVQRFTMKIPKQSLINAGYDESELDDFFADKFGVSSERNINIKPVAQDKVEGNLGALEYAKWYNLGRNNYSDYRLPGTDTYYSIDVTSDMRPDDVNRVNLDLDRDKTRAGASMSKGTFNQRTEDAYSNLDM